MTFLIDYREKVRPVSQVEPHELTFYSYLIGWLHVGNR
jgi:hypothetical protein